VEKKETWGDEGKIVYPRPEKIGLQKPLGRTIEGWAIKTENTGKRKNSRGRRGVHKRRQRRSNYDKFAHKKVNNEDCSKGRRCKENIKRLRVNGSCGEKGWIVNLEGAARRIRKQKLTSKGKERTGT